MKKVVVLTLAIISNGTIFGLNVEKHTDDAVKIVNLLKKVYKQDTRTFLRIKLKSPINKSSEYYQQFFVKTVSEKLSTRLTEIGIISPFGNAEDPRFGDQIQSTPEEGWYLYLARETKKIDFKEPKLMNNHATMCVDTQLKGGNEENRSEFYLAKTGVGWRIDKILWGPKGNFEEKVTQGIHKID